MLIYIKKSVLYTPLIMKMNVYADKCALKYKKEGGGVWKKDRPRVCDDKGLVFMQRVRYKLLG